MPPPAHEATNDWRRRRVHPTASPPPGNRSRGPVVPAARATAARAKRRDHPDPTAATVRSAATRPCPRRPGPVRTRHARTTKTPTKPAAATTTRRYRRPCRTGPTRPWGSAPHPGPHSEAPGPHSPCPARNPTSAAGDTYRWTHQAHRLRHREVTGGVIHEPAPPRARPQPRRPQRNRGVRESLTDSGGVGHS